MRFQDKTVIVTGAANASKPMLGLHNTRKVMGDIPKKPLIMESNRFAAWDLMRAIIDDRLPESNQHNARLAQEMIHGIYAAHLSGVRTSFMSFPLACRKHPFGLKDE